MGFGKTISRSAWISQRKRRKMSACDKRSTLWQLTREKQGAARVAVEGKTKITSKLIEKSHGEDRKDMPVSQSVSQLVGLSLSPTRHGFYEANATRASGRCRCHIFNLLRAETMNPPPRSVIHRFSRFPAGSINPIQFPANCCPGTSNGTRTPARAHFKCS